MAVQTDVLQCRTCGGPLRMNDTECDHCGNPVVITTFNSVKNMNQLSLNKNIASYKKDLSQDPDDVTANKAIAYCYLKLNMYDEALKFFEKAVRDNFDDSETYFYAAVCHLHGKKAFLAMRPDINKIEEYLGAATMIEPKGIYYYFWAYIKYDYYKRKFLVTTPDYMQMLQQAKVHGCSVFDIQQLFSILNVDNPFKG